MILPYSYFYNLLCLWKSSKLCFIGRPLLFLAKRHSKIVIASRELSQQYVVSPSLLKVLRSYPPAKNKSDRLGKPKSSIGWPLDKVITSLEKAWLQKYPLLFMILVFSWLKNDCNSWKGINHRKAWYWLFKIYQVFKTNRVDLLEVMHSNWFWVSFIHIVEKNFQMINW